MAAGRIRRAHGVRGAWAVEAMISAPGVIFAPGAVLIAADREGRPTAEGELHVADGRAMTREWLIRVAEITDRDQAELWRGRILLVDKAALPPPAEGEVDINALLGMEVRQEGVGKVGLVSDVYKAPQGLIIEVDTGKGHPLVPWHPDIVRKVDYEARTIELVILEGLLD